MFIASSKTLKIDFNLGLIRINRSFGQDQFGEPFPFSCKGLYVAKNQFYRTKIFIQLETTNFTDICQAKLLPRKALGTTSITVDL